MQAEMCDESIGLLEGKNLPISSIAKRERGSAPIPGVLQWFARVIQTSFSSMKACFFFPWDAVGLKPVESTFSDAQFQRVDNNDDSLCQKHHYKYVWEWLRWEERDFSSYTQEKILETWLEPSWLYACRRRNPCGLIIAVIERLMNVPLCHIHVF